MKGVQSPGHKRLLQILIHVAAWMGFMCLPVLADTQRIPLVWQSDPAKVILRVVLASFFLILIFYLNALVLVPRFMARRRFILYALSVLAILILMSFWILFISSFIPMGQSEGYPGSARERMVITLFITSNVLIVSTGTTITRSWLSHEQALREAENARQTAELAFLKSQVNPHFLFNSLNSLYALSLTRPAAAPDAILKLSGLMRYLIQAGTDAQTFLDREIGYIEDFISLQRLRMPPNICIQFQVSGQTQAHMIAPMLLVPFVENAFKHGLSPDTPCEININLHSDEQRCVFTVENQIFPAAPHTDSGIGLANVRRRLSLLYPDRHLLNIFSDQHRFFVSLTLSYESPI